MSWIDWIEHAADKTLSTLPVTSWPWHWTKDNAPAVVEAAKEGTHYDEYKGLFTSGLRILNGLGKAGGFFHDVLPWITALLGNKWLWVAVLVLFLIWILQPVLYPAARVAGTPARIWKHATAIERKGVKGNAKAGWKRYDSSAERRNALAYQRKNQPSGPFAYLERRSPPPPWDPRAVVVMASDQSLAEAHVKARLRGRKWKLVDTEPVDSKSSRYHFVRDAK